MHDPKNIKAARRPRLSLFVSTRTAVIPGQDFAVLLENRLKKIAEIAKVIEAPKITDLDL